VKRKAGKLPATTHFGIFIYNNIKFKIFSSTEFDRISESDGQMSHINIVPQYANSQQPRNATTLWLWEIRQL